MGLFCFPPFKFKHLYKIAANNAAGLEVNLLAIGGLVPVVHWNAGGRLHCKLVHRGNQRLKIFCIACKRCGPHYPV